MRWALGPLLDGASSDGRRVREGWNWAVCVHVVCDGLASGMVFWTHGIGVTNCHGDGAKMESSPWCGAGARSARVTLDSVVESGNPAMPCGDAYCMEGSEFWSKIRGNSNQVAHACWSNMDPSVVLLDRQGCAACLQAADTLLR